MTTFGKGYLEPSQGVARGRIRGVSPLPGGPSVARLEVERWVVAPSVPSRGRTIAVSVPAGALTARDQALLAFLGAPRERDSTLWPLVGVIRGDDVELARVEAWIGIEDAAARLPGFQERAAAVKGALLQHLGSEHSGMRTMALQELHRWCDFDDAPFTGSDVKWVEGIALQTEKTDRARALTLLDLAERMRRCTR